MKSRQSKWLNLIKILILPAVIYFVFFLISKGRFGSVGTLFNTLRQSVYPSIISWALYTNLIMGVWDFTPGSIITLSAILGVSIEAILGLGLWFIILIIIISSTIMTLLNCLVFTYLRIPSLISGLGLLMIYEAIASCVNKGSVSLDRSLTFLAKSPYIFMIFLAVFAVAYFLNTRTKFGYEVMALGFGSKLATSIGVKLVPVRFKSFLLEGVFLGVASIINLSYKGAASASINMASAGTALNAILSVFIGIFLARYCNLLLCIFVGAFSLKMVASGIIALGLSDAWQTVANGLFLIVFIGLSSNQNLIFEIREKRKLRKTLQSDFRST